MDLALAYAVAGDACPAGWTGSTRPSGSALDHACRAAKETLFADPKKAAAPVAVLGRGSKVIGGSIKTELTREMLHAVLLDGFFPRCAPTDEPARGRRVGLTEIGLPYAADPAITRHLARFLGRQAGSLHTGGSHDHAVGRPVQRRRVPGRASCVAGCSRSSPSGRASRSPSCRRPTWTWRSRGALRITARSGGARGCEFEAACRGPTTSASRPRRRPCPGVAPPIKALCVVPMGMEEGTEADVPGSEFGLVVGEPAEFRFLSSTTRRDDPIGTVLDRWDPEEIQELAPLETALPVEGDGKGETETVPVRLHTHVNEVGTLELWCQSTRDDRRWKLEYNVREPSED